MRKVWNLIQAKDEDFLMSKDVLVIGGKEQAYVSAIINIDFDYTGFYQHITNRTQRVRY